MKKILIHAWSVKKRDGEYFLPNTHWIYLKEIVQYYDKVILLSACKNIKGKDEASISITEFQNVNVYELPYSSGYIGAIKYFFNYRKAYKEIKNVTTYYARYPIPFGWLQKIYGNNKVKRIIHYVGDPIDVIKNNPNFTILKKKLLINAFKPENLLYNWACKGAQVYTNGCHIAERLSKKNIKAVPLVSSTLNEADFYFKEDKDVDFHNVKLIYLGYLRKAKGVETVIKAFSIVQEKIPNSKLTIIGTGEFELDLKLICKENNIKGITFLGHIDDRRQINQLLREHDIFLFASLSEGSPRVILEAMANGLLVISTPVGSLPKTFEDKKEILFAEFNDEKDFSNKIFFIMKNIDQYHFIRRNAIGKIKDYTIGNFLKKIFYED